MLREGMQSVFLLGAAFYETVFQTEPSNSVAFQADSKYACFQLVHVEDNGENTVPILQTRFYLGFGDHEQEVDITGSSSCAGSDWVVLLVMFFVVHAISWGSRWLVFEPIARRQLQASTTSTKMTKVFYDNTIIEKFSQSSNAAMFHLLSSYFAWCILKPKPWLWSVQDWGNDLQSLNIIDLDFKFYYLLYAARYISDFISLWFEHRRSDTFAYAIHHAASVSLVLLSAQAGVTRIGGVIMFFFDWADPPMMIAKSLVYLSKRPTDLYQFCADRLFEVFAVTFFLTRNLLFNYVVYECLWRQDFLVFHSLPKGQVVLLKSLLVVLVLLMTFWLYLIIKTAIYQLSNRGNVDDIREHGAYKTTSNNGIKKKD